MLGIHFTLDYYTPANININQLSVLGPVFKLSFGYFATIIGSNTAELFFLVHASTSITFFATQ